MIVSSKPKSKGLVYLIDDDDSFRSSLTNALHIAGFDVADFSDVQQFLKTKISEDALILCDMRMPKLSGLDLQALLKKKQFHLPIIFISGESSVNQAVEAMKLGAVDFLTKPFDPETLFRLITKTLKAQIRQREDRAALKALSPREKTAFQFIIQGFGNPYIAEKMAIKESTVKEFKTNIFKKLGVRNISELIERYKD